ncbi:hypothetical protein E2C01_071046 [Portunus trituberculatus]|uniref:Uncharacterized protein n=1 Tax=Portunus trituberculatus TaxID=210409 RepID=A0A5B7I480_PORTR|nr:hypothetical protein [Portunus trituberculatus]
MSANRALHVKTDSDTACATLHNIAIMNNIPLETENDLQLEENANDIDIDGDDDDVGPRGVRRARYIELHF